MALLLPPPRSVCPAKLLGNASALSLIPIPLVSFPRRSNQSSNGRKIIGYMAVNSRSTRVRESPSTDSHSLIKEPHKYFDQVIITVRAGDGGHGAVLDMPNQKENPKPQGKYSQDKTNKKSSRARDGGHGAVLNMPNQKANPKPQGKYCQNKTNKKSSYKRDSDGSLILPMGGHGGDVVIYADEGEETLLEFHQKRRYCAKRGGNVDAMGTLTKQLHNGFAAPTLRIPVPIGTVVKHKRGKMLADLARPGDEILVARGGQGGISLLEMPEYKRKRLMALSTNVMRDESDKILVLGQPGEEVSLELVLRVVADVGLVGLPNAGKSTLLAAITLAKPDIADYPFTTLMPNLGRLDGDPMLGALKYSSEATLADLPGLIEGAHLGKGLGRNFLRHLRRTQMLLHVVDAATENPVKDYMTVKEELRMYNPEYLQRPYIVLLNKIDLLEAQDRLQQLVQEISAIGCKDATDSEISKTLTANTPDLHSLSSGEKNEETKEKEIADYPQPLAVVGASVLKQIGVNELLKAIRAGLRKCRDLEQIQVSEADEFSTM
ncbi:probable GTP-binding protein OBGC2 [Zingiber officinale]|nr:probable GTP-binding protein OBGC2 [Zingiber officinale]